MYSYVPKIVGFAQRFNNRQAIDRALKQAQADKKVAAAKAFDQGDFETFLNEFFKAIHSRYDIEKPVVQRLIRKKLNIINRLKAENVCLKQDMEKQRKRLQDYAREYYAMGNECITQARDARAALANYDKTLEALSHTDAWVRKRRHPLQRKPIPGSRRMPEPCRTLAPRRIQNRVQPWKVAA